MNRVRLAPCLLAALVLHFACALGADDFTSHVDPYIGSGGHGHVFVGASVPFGAVQVGPANAAACSGNEALAFLVILAGGGLIALIWVGIAKKLKQT